MSETGIPGLPEGAVPVGDVTNYYAKIGVAAVLLYPDGELNVGDEVCFVRKDTNEWDSQRVGSIEKDHQPIATAKGGEHVGVKIGTRVEKSSIIYRQIQPCSHESSFVRQ